jgi:PAS domain-containing protein
VYLKENCKAVTVEVVLEWLKNYAALVSGATLVLSHLVTVHRRLQGIADKFAKIDEIHSRLKAIEQEVRPNGGSSMRDAIVRAHDEVMFISQLAKITTNHAPAPVLLFDREGMCTWINQPAATLLDLAAVDYKGRGWIGAFEDPSDVLSGWQSAVAASSSWVYPATTNAGKVIRLQFQVISHNNKVLGWVTTTLDTR